MHLPFVNEKGSSKRREWDLIKRKINVAAAPNILPLRPNSMTQPATYYDKNNYYAIFLTYVRPETWKKLTHTPSRVSI